MNPDTPRLHPDVGDIDYHLQDALQAVRNGSMVRTDNPWCLCRGPRLAIFTCPVCGRLYGPRKEL